MQLLFVNIGPVRPSVVSCTKVHTGGHQSKKARSKLSSAI